MRRQVASLAQSNIGGQGDEKDSAKSNEKEKTKNWQKIRQHHRSQKVKMAKGKELSTVANVAEISQLRSDYQI